MADKEIPVVLSVDGDRVVVQQPALLRGRSARMYFDAVLGGTMTADGWSCPRRRLPAVDLVVRINTWLERHGWTVDRRGIADEAVERQVQRRRSFARTRDHAAALRDGVAGNDIDQALSAINSFGWNSESRPLLDHQLTGLRHGLAAVNAANFSVPGSGKTATTLAIGAVHLQSGTIDAIVVVGPLSCFGPWEKEAHAALPGRLRVRRARGAAPRRREVYDDVSRGDLLLLSYATAAADQAYIIDLCRSRRVMLVVDESHRIKRFRGGQWAPALMRIAEYARVRLVLSGTPMPQSGKDLYSQLSVLWPGQELTGPRDAFAARIDSNFASMLESIQPFLSRTPKEALGLAPYTVRRHEVTLSGIQAEIYELIEGNFRRRLEDALTYQEKINTLRRGRPVRLLQAAANPDLLNKSDAQFRLGPFDVPNPTLMQRLQNYSAIETPAKSLFALDLIRSIAADGGKVVAWSNFVLNLDQFSALVKASLSLPVYQIDGRIPVGDESSFDAGGTDAYRDVNVGESRERIIDAFLAGQGPAVLVANPASCSESISLHSSCHNAIYLDRTYDSALFLQSIDRIHRLGLPPSVDVTVHLLLATLRGGVTVDGLVDTALQRKQEAMQKLLEGAELRPLQLDEDEAVLADGDDQDLAELLRFLLGEQA